MSTKPSPIITASKIDELPNIPLSYSVANSQTSASQLIYTLFPEWAPERGGRGLKFVRFTDGITNTLLKCIHDPPKGIASSEAGRIEDSESVLLRAYGRDTGILIDRDRECASHLLLSRFNLAPELLARFTNGLLYRYVPGRVCSVQELAEPAISKAVATRLGEWHGVLPTSTTPPPSPASSSSASSGEPDVTLWTVLQKWISAIPSDTDEEKARKESLQEEYERLLTSIDEGGYGLKGLDGGVGLVMGHCDLLSGNVIIPPQEGGPSGSRDVVREVHFIDYEYSTPCERAFELANHFSEWGGLECDYSRLPTRSVRREFISTYLSSFELHRSGATAATISAGQIDDLMNEVDLFRGIPGFYWGVWALIQATISQIDFDYASYADVRLAEYWAWKETFEGRAVSTPREQRWSQE
ncbi:kinase-like domain-containing protein [Tuber brumale]|nr:kinase-like domain-containing protein [Tuber brumale]